MWSKVLKPVPAPQRSSRPQPAALPSHAARPAPVLQSSRVPQQLSFEFRRG
jgi:hypothetical protein